VEKSAYRSSVESVLLTWCAPPQQRRPRCIYAPRVKRLAAESLSSSPPLPPPDPPSRSSASSSLPPLAPPGLPSSVPLPPRRPYRVACRAGELIRSRLHYLLLNNRRLDSPSIRVSSPSFRRCGHLPAYPRAYIVWTPKTDPSCLSYRASLVVADPIIRKDISKHIILLGRLCITRGSLSTRLFTMRGRDREVSRIRWNLRGTDAPAFPLIQCVWFVLRGGSWVLNASRSGAGVSNALPYYLLLIGSAFVELFRLILRRKIPRLYDWLSSLQLIILC